MVKHQLRPNEKLGSGIKRVAIVLVQRVISTLTDGKTDQDIAIHNARKSCKMLRGILRLIRSGLTGDFSLIDDKVRDASAKLAGLRDHDVMTETFNSLQKSAVASIPAEVLAIIGGLLTQRNLTEAPVLPDRSEQITLFLKDMQELMQQIPNWKFQGDLSKVARAGFVKTYRRGREQMNAAARLPVAGRLHCWRKSVKYHDHHLRLLSLSWKGSAAKRSKRLMQLSEALGDDHDLALIQDKLRCNEAKFSSREERAGLQQFNELIASRRGQLQVKAFKLGSKLYRRRPAAIAHKLSRR
jgi:CHAD domain-containing protein